MDNQIEILEENKKKGSKRPYVVAIVLALALVVTITATSYAYFVANVTGTGQNTVVTTTSLEIEFTDGPQVTLENAVPGQYVEKTFKVENKGSGDTTYDVYMSDLINGFADKTDLVYTLTSNDGGYNVSSETQVPDTSSKIVNALVLRAGEAHNYTLRIELKETNDNQDDNKGKTFSTIIRVNEVQNAQPPYSVESGDLNTVGSVVKIADEEFYVIGQEDSSHVKLLSKWNLNVGNNPKGTATGLQDSDVRGYRSDGGTTYGRVDFSSTSYWFDGTNRVLKNQYGSSYPAYVYDNNSILYQYVDNYVTYLNNQGVNVTGRLISNEELVSLGCIYKISKGYCDSNEDHGGTAPSWVYQTSYWSGSAQGASSLMSVTSDGGFDYLYFNYSSGVRPVIILES